ncbi:oligosaccharide flippase family protein [Globicatella sanguinis]
MNKSNLKTNFLYNFLYQALILIVPLVTSPYLTRVLGAEGLGTYSFSQSYANYFMLFIMLGVNNYGNREISRVRDNKNEVNKTFTEIYCLQFVLMIIFSIIYFFTIYISFGKYKIIYFIQLIYVISGGLDINWCCFGLEKFKLAVVRNSIIKSLNALAIFLFIKDENDLVLYTLLSVISIFLSQIVIWPFILKEIKFVKVKKEDVIKRIKPNFILFLPVIAVSLYTIMDKLMLGMMSSKTEVAYYTYAERITQIPTAFIAALGTVMLPRASNLISNGKEHENIELINKSMQVSIFIAASSSFGLMAIANELIPWYYGLDFTRSAVFTTLLSPIVIFISWNNVIRTQFIIPKGLDRIYIISVSSGALSNLILNILLIPIYDGIGAIIATLFANLIISITQYILVRDYIDFRKFLPNTLIFCLIGMSMGVIVYYIPSMFSMFISILYKIGIGAIYFITLSYFYLVKVKKDYFLFNSAKSFIKRVFKFQSIK